MKQKIKDMSKADIFFFAVFVFSALLFFGRIYTIIMSVHDDMRIYTLVRSGDLVSNAVHSAKSGRITHLWNHELLGFPFLLNKVWFYKLVSYSTTIAGVWAMWLFVYEHIDKHLSWICAALYMSLASISANHNLFISYAFCHQLPLVFIILSLHFYLKGVEEKKTKYTVISTILFLFSCMIYEAFLPYLLVFVLMTARTGNKQKLPFVNYLWYLFKTVIPHTITGVIYCIVYFTWQHFYPSDYEGTALYLDEPITSIQATIEYSTSYIPLHDAGRIARMSAQPLMNILGAVPLLGWVKNILICTAFVIFLVKYAEKVDFKGFFLSFVGAVFIPNILVSFSKQHLDAYKRGAIQYVSSYYSYSFIIIILAIFACLLYRFLKGKNFRIIGTVFMTSMLLGLCICADLSVTFWNNYYTPLTRRYKNFDIAVATEEVTNCDSNWQIYAPDNMGIHAAESYTLDYIGIYDDTPAASYVLKEDQLVTEKQTLCMRSDKDYLLMAFGETDKNLAADELTVASVLPMKFDVVLKSTTGKEETIKGVSNGDVIKLPDGERIDMHTQIAVENYY